MREICTVIGSVGAATAIVVGLVAVTPAAGFISPMNAIILGAIAAVPSYIGLIVRVKTGLDDSLDVVAAHGVGGTVGALLTGVFADMSLPGGLANGLLFGNPAQLGVQATAVAAATVYSGVGTFPILKVIGLIVPLHRKTVVQRNLVRRRLRELARTRLLPPLGSADVVIFARPDAYSATFDQLAAEIEMAVVQVNRMLTPKP